jgi:hypothetical protein
MKIKAIIAFVAAGSLLIFLYATTQHGELMSYEASAACGYCCVITTSGMAVIKSATASAFFAPVLFILSFIFFIPKRTPISLYHPPRQ